MRFESLTRYPYPHPPLRLDYVVDNQSICVSYPVGMIHSITLVPNHSPTSPQSNKYTPLPGDLVSTARLSRHLIYRPMVVLPSRQ